MHLLGPCNPSRGPSLLIKPQASYKVAQVETRLGRSSPKLLIFYILPNHTVVIPSEVCEESSYGLGFFFLSSAIRLTRLGLPSLRVPLSIHGKLQPMNRSAFITTLKSPQLACKLTGNRAAPENCRGLLMPVKSRQITGITGPAAS